MLQPKQMPSSDYRYLYAAKVMLPYLTSGTEYSSLELRSLPQSRLPLSTLQYGESVEVDVYHHHEQQYNLFHDTCQLSYPCISVFGTELPHGALSTPP